LGNAVVVPEIEKQELAVIAFPTNPSGKPDDLAGVGFPEGPAGVGSKGVHKDDPEWKGILYGREG
jgi:hypothetical protein